MIVAGQENNETSFSVNTLHDAPESTNQKMPLPLGVKETLARKPMPLFSVSGTFSRKKKLKSLLGIIDSFMRPFNC